VKATGRKEKNEQQRELSTVTEHLQQRAHRRRCSQSELREGQQSVGSVTVKKKRELFPGVPPASQGSVCVTTELRTAWFRDFNLIPFRIGGGLENVILISPAFLFLRQKAGTVSFSVSALPFNNEKQLQEKKKSEP